MHNDHDYSRVYEAAGITILPYGNRRYPGFSAFILVSQSKFEAFRGTGSGQLHYLISGARAL